MNTSADGLTYKTAIVIIPTREVWDPIQATRQQHDVKVHRWKSHITLIYPFRRRTQFDSAEEALASACSTIAAFEITLPRFDRFSHGRGSFTLWLAPEPVKPIQDLHSALCRSICKDQQDLHHVTRRFTPHLSVGQARGAHNMLQLFHELQANGKTVHFRVDSVQLIWRNDPPNDVFRIDRSLPLGGGQSMP